jgi:hypothetical protein
LVRTSIICCAIVSLLLAQAGKAQVQKEPTGYSFFIEPEMMIGKIVPNYNDFPRTDQVKSYFLSIGVKDNRNTHCGRFYNHPSSGLSFSYSQLGNDSIFGTSVSLIPFIEFQPFPRYLESWHLKFGIGASYISKSYKDNVTNLAIGSRLSWAFQAFMYRDLYAGKRMNVKVGGGYFHNSNGHTQLPNMGLNSAMLSLSCQWVGRPIVSKREETYHGDNPNPRRLFFLNYRGGLGFHEYGGKSKPVGGPKKLVYSTAISAGILFNQHVKVRSGFTYRFYQHYYEKITETENPDFIDDPYLNASNIYFHLGCEFLIGHFGLDIEGGLNLFKPYYETYYRQFASVDRFKYKLKKYFSSRMGLNFYVINTNKIPRNNVFIGANINANFGQADFTELSIGYTYTFK